MPKKPREPKRKRLPAAPKPQSILQVMPGGRVRLDPSVIRDLACFIDAYSRRYDRKASMTLRGLKNHEREHALGERRAADASLRTIAELILHLCDTVDIRLIDSALASWDRELVAPLRLAEVVTSQPAPPFFNATEGGE